MLNELYRQFGSAFRDPNYALNYALSSAFPGMFRRNYVKQAKKAGIGSNYLLLSFDCDTEKDIEVAEDVHDRLFSKGIVPSYAVPGELLLKGSSTYRRLMKLGAEFINHGYLSHTSYTNETKSYVSTIFYDQLTNEEIKTDIIRGHEACVDVLGLVPEGFRTPHFGTYQRRSQLEYLYSLLQDLGYKFSSSTTPVTGMWYGPVKRTKSSIVELPVSGSFDYPVRILDSWSFRFSPTRKLTEDDYVKQFKKVVNFYNSHGNVGVLNIYADPSQVYDWEAFFDCMDLVKNFENVSFSELIRKVCP